MFDEPTALTPKAREQVGLGVSVAASCQPCFLYHLHQLRGLGGTSSEIMEIITLARRACYCSKQEMDEFIVEVFNDELSTASISVEPLESTAHRHERRQGTEHRDKESKK